MKSEFAKVRSIAGLFLEALMLVFIFAYANGNFVANDEPVESQPLKSVVLSYSVALSTPPSSQAFYILSKDQIWNTDFFPLTVDVHGICLAMSKALSVSRFERNTFYIASADNIP